MDVKVGNVREEGERARGRKRAMTRAVMECNAMMRFPRARYSSCASTCPGTVGPVEQGR
jgi:hypothetical protein